MLSKITKNIFVNYRLFHTSNKCYAGLTKIVDKDGVRQIILQDQKTRNSLSLPMMSEIHDGIRQNIDDDKLRVVILSSSLDKIFSAGHNLKELEAKNTAAEKKEVFAKLTEIIKTINTVPVPVIAKIDGLAAAAGCQLVTSCDMLVASNRSSFSLPGANVGIFCSTPGVAVVRKASLMKTSYLLFTGLPISADEAYTAGMISRIVVPEKLDEEMDIICNSIKKKSRAVISLGKKFFHKQISMNIFDAFASAEDVMVQNLETNDGKEGLKSFIEKKPPKWTNS